MASDRMSRFEIFIGTWNTSGEVLATEGAQATILSATDTYRWLPGRKFVIHEADARFGTQVARSTEMIGYDKASGRYLARSYDDKGVSETFEVALQRKRWTITGENVRFDGRFNAAGNELIGLWELKGSRSGWQPWIKLRLVRA